MKATILNASIKGDNSLDVLHQVIVDELEVIDWEVESLILHDIKIASCLGCFGCWVKTPGICVIDDAGRDVAKKVIQSDLVVYLTPVTFGGYSSELKKAVDRLIPLISPFFTKIGGETHHKRRYERYPRFLYVGLLPQADQESERLFLTLVERNAINFRTPAHAGSVVLSSRTSEDIREEIRTLLIKVEVRDGGKK